MATARSYLAESQKRELREYEDGLLGALNRAGFNEQTKNEYYNVLMNYKINVLVTKSLVARYKKLQEKNKKINEKYKRESNDAKAELLKQEYSKNRSEMIKIKKLNDQYKSLAQKQEDVVRQIDNSIEQRLAQRGYVSSQDNTPKGPTMR